MIKQFRSLTQISKKFIGRMEASMDVSNMRVEYKQGILCEDSVDKDPFVQFKRWFTEVLESKLIREVNAMGLSTVSKDGYPSSRIVLLKVINHLFRINSR